MNLSPNEYKSGASPGRIALLLGALIFTLVQPAAGRLLRTRPTPLEQWNPLVALTIGSSVEYEHASDKSQLELPFFIEYNFTPVLKATVEHTVIHLDPRAKHESAQTGLGDLETSLDYEFLRERRYQPALTAEGVVRWPAATRSDLGDPGRDYSFGLIASKDLVLVDLDLSLIYTSVGDRKSQDTLELALAAEWHLNYLFDLETEVVHSFGGGDKTAETSLGLGGVIRRAAGDVTEGTVGVAWHANKRLKLEHGATFSSDGTWRVVLAWEFSFGGN